jgi:hypothetical protein
MKPGAVHHWSTSQLQTDPLGGVGNALATRLTTIALHAVDVERKDRWSALRETVPGSVRDAEKRRKEPTRSESSRSRFERREVGEGLD